MSKEIEVTLDGEKIDINAKGFKGKGCMDASKFITKLGKVKEVKKKREYHEVEPDPIFNNVKR